MLRKHKPKVGESHMIHEWPEFYDPNLYEEKVGPGRRVGETYSALLEGPPLRIIEYGCGPGEYSCVWPRTVTP